MSWSHYLLQVNIYLIVFYIFYRLLLAKETYFVLNRIYLICSGIFSLALPFMQVDWFSKQELSQQIYVQVEHLSEYVVQTDAPMATEQLNWGSLIALLYLVGAVFFTARLTLKLIAVKKMLNGVKSGLAFSFWKKKVVAQNIPEAATVSYHEDIHIKQLHTFDVIFFELLGIITWFNPIIYLYKETIKSVHEYLADEAAAKYQGDKELYSMLLLNQAFGVNNNTITNGFFKKSMIKKRISMLYKERSRKAAIIKYGIFLPLFASALLFSSATIKRNERLLAAAQQVPFEQVSAVVSETLELETAKAVEVMVSNRNGEVLKVNNNESDHKALYKFLGDNVRYSKVAQAKHIQGNIIVNFIVYKEKITSIDINPKLGYGIEEEITKVLKTFDAKTFNNDKYSIRIELRLNGATTPILNDRARVQKGYTALNTITIMGYAAKPQIDGDNDLIYNFVSMETPPSYPGGIAKFYQFLGENIKYPKEAFDNKIQGNVFVSFTVEKDGSLSDIKIDRKLGYGTDEEAVRVLKLSRKWNPGINNGRLVRVKYNIPIKFTLNTAASAPVEVKAESKVQGIFLTPENIVIKGSEFFDAEKSPLYILDGKPLESGKIKELVPESIKSIYVLKDESAVQMYGDKALNGVVLIVTKKDATKVTGKPINN